MAIGNYLKEAQQLRTIQAKAVTEGEPFFSRKLFRVEGQPGIWRRVGRTGSGLKKKAEGNVLSFDEDKGQIMELARYTDAEIELGIDKPPF